MLRARYENAETFEEHIAGAENRDLWLAFVKRAVVPADVVARAAAVPGRWHLLALSESWCGDAVNILPPVAALAAAAPKLELRVLRRDANLDLMDAHLTAGSRSIPVVLVLDDRYRERGWWGPRPRALQAWVASKGRTLEAKERYREMRGWYARDHGRSTLEEIVSLIERVAREREAA